MTQAAHPHHAPPHQAHPPHLAHHFDTPEQQYETSKLGMWVFLATEILMFGGLFCAYSVYRANHPEVFSYAHHYLDTNLGAINTVVLLISSWTMAMAVRSAQLGQRKALMLLLVLTLVGGSGFMVIKGIEYKTKFQHDIGPGVWNLFTPQSDVERAHELDHLEHEYGLGGHGGVGVGPQEHVEQVSGHDETPGLVLGEGSSVAEAIAHQGEDDQINPYLEASAPPALNLPVDHTLIPPAAEAPEGLNPALSAGDERLPAHVQHGIYSYDELSRPDKARVHTFFQLYFLMTGLHGIHVLIGMGLIAYIFVRAARDDFGPAYYTPVDVVGLYWHLVDLIWIFLFPLLYLIH